MIALFHDLCEECSKATTRQYSTSFCSSIKLLHQDFHAPVFNIYGFVRFADEIVDTFHAYNKEELLVEFKRDTYLAIERGISLNPILHSFQQTISNYGIPVGLVDSFFKSMEMDLSKTHYSDSGYKEYIYGSAEVVGLMCLYIFCEGKHDQYQQLKPYAQSLGAAFQKVNFLRDVKADYEGMNRTYFPGIDFTNFTYDKKNEIEADIAAEFRHAYEGIVRLPIKARFGVYVAYKYYLSLFRKIKKMEPSCVLEQRVRIPNYGKAYIMVKAGLRNRLNIL